LFNQVRSVKKVMVCGFFATSDWRRGQDSNLHSLSAGGFQDRCTTIMRPLRSLAFKIYLTSSTCSNRCVVYLCVKTLHMFSGLQLNQRGRARGHGGEINVF